MVPKIRTKQKRPRAVGASLSRRGAPTTRAAGASAPHARRGALSPALGVLDIWRRLATFSTHALCAWVGRACDGQHVWLSSGGGAVHPSLPTYVYIPRRCWRGRARARRCRLCAFDSCFAALHPPSSSSRSLPRAWPPPASLAFPYSETLAPPSSCSAVRSYSFESCHPPRHCLALGTVLPLPPTAFSLPLPLHARCHLLSCHRLCGCAYGTLFRVVANALARARLCRPTHHSLLRRHPPPPYAHAPLPPPLFRPPSRYHRRRHRPGAAARTYSECI